MDSETFSDGPLATSGNARATGRCSGRDNALALPVIPYGRAIWDFLFVLDGAYRIGLGQLPHIDFSSPVGSLTLFMAAARRSALSRFQSIRGAARGHVAGDAAALALLAPRFHSGAAFAAALFMTSFMILVPFTVDSTHLSEISYFATYNRFATGLLFLVGLWYVLPKSRFDWLLLAYLLALLFFLKITTAAIAVCIVLAAVMLGRARVSTLAGALAGVGCPAAHGRYHHGTGFRLYRRHQLHGLRQSGRRRLRAVLHRFPQRTVLAAVAGLAVVIAAELVRQARLLNRMPTVADLSIAPILASLPSC